MTLDEEQVICSLIGNDIPVLELFTVGPRIANLEWIWQRELGQAWKPGLSLIIGASLGLV
jgi:hypothetical protein